MKRNLLFFTLILFSFSLKAQLVQITNETFESTLTGLTIIPSTSWKPDTNLYAGGHTSYRGYVPISNQPGDTSILTSPFYDLSSYKYVWLTFNQICKVSATDICQIEYRQDYVGSPWKAIPTSSYQGNGMYMNACFSQDSYTDWQPGDSLAKQSNAWWQTENFNISDEVSFAKVQFRFKITRGSAIGSYFVHGWLIDNFKITASVNPIAPPVVEFISSYSDTVYNTGPFVIKAKVATRTIAPLRIPKLYYSATYGGITRNDSIAMTAIEGDSIWTATIPQHFLGSSIVFSVVAFDTVGNTNNAADGFYLKRLPSSGVSGYVIVGNGTITHYYTPASMYYNYSWARMLYLSSEISASSVGGLITKLAWSYDNTIGVIYNNQTCYFKAVDDTVLVTGYLDPIADGATQVWAGKLNIAQGWVEINLNAPFYLPPGKHLHVYWHHEEGSSLLNTCYWNHTNTPVYRTVQAQNNTSFPSGTSGSLRFGRPNASFYVVSGVSDSNSVALHSIDNPIRGTVGGTQAVKVTIKNKGMKHLDSCTINWTVNNVLQIPTVWRGHLPEDFNDTLTLGYYTQRYSMYDTIVVWVNMPNGVVDTTTFDDTLRVVSYGCFGAISGDFIVGTATGADIPSIDDAFFIGSMCGVNGDVTLKLQNNTYVENWDFSNLSTIMGNHTLIITTDRLKFQ